MWIFVALYYTRAIIHQSRSSIPSSLPSSTNLLSHSNTTARQLSIRSRQQVIEWKSVLLKSTLSQRVRPPCVCWPVGRATTTTNFFIDIHLSFCALSSYSSFSLRPPPRPLLSFSLISTAQWYMSNANSFIRYIYCMCMHTREGMREKGIGCSNEVFCLFFSARKTPVITKQGPQEEVFKVGETVTLPCLASGAPAPEWAH